MPSSLYTGIIFLINTLFSIYLFILAIRLILVWTRADYHHPVSQFIVRLTQFIIGPLRRLVPSLGRFESATFLLLVVLDAVKFLLLTVISLGALPNFFGLGLLALSDSAKVIVDIFFYAILMQAILSWIQPYSPLNQGLKQFTAPIMRPLQRIIPPIQGMDISPLVALIALQLLLIILLRPLIVFAMQWAVGFLLR